MRVDLCPLDRLFSPAIAAAFDPDPRRVSVVADLSLQKRPECYKQFFGKERPHFSQVRDNLGVGRGDLSRQFEQHQHILRGLGCSQTFKQLIVFVLQL